MRRHPAAGLEELFVVKPLPRRPLPRLVVVRIGVFGSLAAHPGHHRARVKGGCLKDATSPTDQAEI